MDLKEKKNAVARADFFMQLSIIGTSGLLNCNDHTKLLHNIDCTFPFFYPHWRRASWGWPAETWRIRRWPIAHAIPKKWRTFLDRWREPLRKRHRQAPASSTPTSASQRKARRGSIWRWRETARIDLMKLPRYNYNMKMKKTGTVIKIATTVKLPFHFVNHEIIRASENNGRRRSTFGTWECTNEFVKIQAKSTADQKGT